MKLLVLAVALLLQIVLQPCAGQDSSIPYLVGISPIITFVREDTETNHEVVDLHAYDPQGTIVEYSLDTDGPFDIDSDLGRIFVNDTLDREMVDFYMLVATVTDTEGLSGNITIDVTILDINDNSPRVDNTLNITLRELTEVGTRVHTIITSDPDIGDSGSVEFTLVSNGDFVTDQSFSVARFSGDITLVQNLDHEAVGQHILTIRISDLGTPMLSTIVNLTINVLDENDIAPVFTRSLYTARVPEGDTPGVRVTRVLAIDADNLGADIDYDIEFGNIDNVFEIQSDGLIVTRGSLDRELRSRYILTVEATEASVTSDAAAAVTTVTVEVEDVNDNPPAFHSSLYTGFAREDAAIGTNVISTVAAFDNDLGDNAAFRFRLSSDNASDVPFAIDSNRGSIYIEEMLDYETDTFYEFEIEVYEIRSTEMLSGTAMVHIFIIDANDNPPVFELDSYNVNVIEEQQPGALVTTITATDEDAGPAGVLTYMLLGADNERFSVDANGNIRTTVILDREEIDQYYLTLIVMDTSNNPLITTTTVIVDVNDINDNCPEFDPSINYDFILLEEMIHMNFFTPIVIDRDYGANAEYTFNISDGTYFNVDPTTGALSLIDDTLDHEIVSNRFISVLMIACDMGTDPEMMCCNQTINITLRDRNDNTPQFVNDPFVVSVTENLPEGRGVINATAVDMDHGTNAELRYTIVDNDNAGPFLINSTTGEIFTVGKLDWESQELYSIQVRVEDRGSDPLYDTATVNIYVRDVNEFTPRFNSTVLNVAVHENVPLGHNVTTISASDPDGSSDGEVSYTFEGNASSYFSIGRYTGVLTTTRILDRERSPYILFDIRASDELGLYNVTTVNVTIVDVNDNCPEFITTLYSMEIDESTPTGGMVVQVYANDPDNGLNGEVLYSFGPDAPAQFSINRDTGLITVDPNNPLDYETTTTYSFTVVANDMGNVPCPNRSNSEAIVVVTVTDANDEVCEFHTAIYNEMLLETETVDVDTPIITFTANDGDQPGTDNSRVFYYVDQRDDNQLFDLNSTSGELYIPAGGSLDRDISDINQAPNCRAIYRYRIEGRDQGNPPLSCFADVLLYVEDINDNPPEFEPLDQPVRVSESAIIGSLVHVVQATDADCGTNAAITYSIVSGNRMESFAIDSSGTITVNNVLDKEMIEEYSLTIRAVNTGSSSMNSTAVIRIVIEDHNDNNPNCTQIMIDMCINESHPVDSKVAMVDCMDPDSTVIGEGSAPNDVVYGFAGGNINEAFAVDSSTGVISLARSVDRETLDFYRLIVYAEDTGVPPRREFIEVSICIMDVDDNCPVFSQEVYIGSVSENAAPGTLVNVRPFLSATDADIGANAEIIYSFEGGSHDQFAVADDTGLVTVIGDDLNRENVSNITILLLATDNPACQATSMLVVELIDANDNSPVFIDFPNTTEICEDASIGDEMLTITASDLDSGNNGLVTFHLINSDEDFAINRSTGVVTVNRPLDRERKERYSIIVVATDSGLQPQSSSAIMLVTILDINDNLPRADPPNLDTCVPEHSNASVVVLRLSDSIIDGDLGLNGKLLYSIVSSSPFTVGPDDGIVTPTSASELDRENMEIYDVIFRVTDQGGNRSSFIDTSPSTMCTAITNPPVDITVRICLEDINDNAPSFNEESYIVDVPEGTLADAIVFRLFAKDNDAGQNAVVNYMLSTATPASGMDIFRIEPDSGIIRTRIMIDELEPSYRFLVLATDMGTRPQVTPVNVTIRIRDSNDNNPICNQTFYEFNVTENVTSPAFVGVVSAYDLDSIGSQLDYSILQHPSQQSMFNVDSTGTITTNQRLDREQFSTHIVTVVVTDAHNASRIGYCTVFVMVDDQNDECPVFLNSSGVQLFVMENSFPNVSVGQVIATDADAGNNALVNYAISAGDPEDNFNISMYTGEIVTGVTAIDRETISIFFLTVCATDAGPPIACPNACINVTILVQDVCDHKPEFHDLPLEVEFGEANVVGSTVTTVTASDLDLGENGIIRYSITDGNIGNAFAIGEFSGDVTVANDLDYDAPGATRVYVLNITAADLCENGGRNQTGTLTVRLVNEDDHPPECPNIMPLPNATEGENVDVFYQYQATDLDASPYNISTYTILSESTGNVFSIDQDNGIIRVIRGNLIDRETMSIYCETVSVGSSHPTLTCLFCVNIVDANDNCPMFSASSINVSVPEGLSAGAVVDTITAVDDDVGVNAQFGYQIAGGTGQGLFNINDDGRITTTAVLDRENTSSYTLMVETVDMGSPPQTCSATINIIILDANDNAPSFINCEGPHNVTENVAFGTEVLRISATDDDIGENGLISYYFDGENNEFGPFQINTDTGVVNVVADIDREKQSSYTVTVHATDHGPSPRNTFCSIIININDVDDNIPSFVMNPVITLCENVTVGSPVGTLSDVARDVDAAPNNITYYYNPSNLTSNCIDIFCFNNTTGSLWLTDTLDFETSQSHTLRIAISNNDTLSINSDVEEYRVGDVTIEVCDVNDVAPRFINDGFTAGVSETTDLGDTIFELQATDPESGDFGIVWYRSVTADFRYNVSRETGNIISNQISQGKAGTSFKFEVEAYDNKGKQPSLSTRQEITVWILHDGQRVIITMDVPRDLVLAKQHNITDALNSISSYIIVIQKIRLAENDDQTNVDASKTDVIIYGIDPNTDTVIDGSVLIDIIDNNFLAIETLLAECHVQSVRPYPTTSEVTESTFEDEIWLIIIGVLAALIILLCLCLLACCIVCRRQRKYIKHTEAVDSYNETMRQIVIDQSINVNPLWAETKEVDFDDDDAASRQERNTLYESKEIVMEMMPPPDSAEPSVHSMAIAEPPAGAATLNISKHGQVAQSTLTKSYRQSYEQETHFTTTTTTKTATYDRVSMDSDTVNALLEETLNQPGNRDSNTIELLAAAASDEEVPDDKDNTALL